MVTCGGSPRKLTRWVVWNNLNLVRKTSQNINWNYHKFFSQIVYYREISLYEGKITGFRDWNVQAILSHPLPTEDISAGNLENTLHFSTGMRWKHSMCSKTLHRVSSYVAPNKWAGDMAPSPCPINTPTLVPAVSLTPSVEVQEVISQRLQAKERYLVAKKCT